jgi:hypothetical protein
MASSLISTIHDSLLQSLSLLQPAVSSLVVSWQRLLTVEILQLRRSRRYGPANILELKSLRRPGFLVILPRGGTNSKHHFQNVPIVAMGGCLAIAEILLTCLPAVTKQRMFLLAIVAQHRYYTLQYTGWNNMYLC